MCDVEDIESDGHEPDANYSGLSLSVAGVQMIVMPGSILHIQLAEALSSLKTEQDVKSIINQIKKM